MRPPRLRRARRRRAGCTRPRLPRWRRGPSARKELEAQGIKPPEFKPKWWGFEIHLTQEAVEKYLEIKDLLADILSEAVKEPLSSLITLAALA
ncbi:hypothetical protein HET69_26320 [Streptomyces sp. CJ_13]|uniref:hypothetical protein n=1 Tax=Streptomyces sp. CJ_13 TaxID=2724943 RepID=UPI001BDBDF59|nr:hypothetical protein [Streptomyces sp. CJ_13]MBT1187417.1 hypothetical protein [Streptomyces sp. CJ_13]